MSTRSPPLPRTRKPPEPEPEPEPVHLKLRRLVDARRGGRTDQDIAALAGMSPAVFSRLLGGGVPNPRFGTVMRVLRAVGATLCDLEHA